MHSFGPVIPPQDRERIFDRYFRSSAASERAPGTGIGLSIAKRAALAHGGSVWVASDERDGTTFLRLHSLPRGKSSGPDHRPREALMTPIRVLVVDDEPAIRRALRPPLTELGFEMTEASRGEMALEILRTEPFDAVLLDVNMPGIGGIETLRRIRAMAPRLPVIMLTVRDREEEKVNALELGADDYVTKPFGVRELVARIRAAVRRVHAPAVPDDQPIVIGEIALNPSRRSVTKRGQSIHLTRKEFDILHCLMSRAGRVITYARLLTAVWGAESREEVEYLRTFVRQLRKKIEDDPAHPAYLLTDIYVGYRFADQQMLDEAQAANQDRSLRTPMGAQWRRARQRRHCSIIPRSTSTAIRRRAGARQDWLKNLRDRAGSRFAVPCSFRACRI